MPSLIVTKCSVILLDLRCVGRSGRRVGPSGRWVGGSGCGLGPPTGRHGARNGHRADRSGQLGDQRWFCPELIARQFAWGQPDHSWRLEALPRQPRHEYAAVLPRSLPAGTPSRLRSRSPNHGWSCTASWPISTRF